MMDWSGFVPGGVGIHLVRGGNPPGEGAQGARRMPEPCGRARIGAGVLGMQKGNAGTTGPLATPDRGHVPLP